MLIALAVASPVGILLPAILNGGNAWGEWSVATLEKMIGFVPEGLRKTADWWKPLIPDYNTGIGTPSRAGQALFYIFSGLIGIALCVLIICALSKLLIRRK